MSISRGDSARHPPTAWLIGSAVIIAVLCVLTYGQVLGLWFTGIDALPIILSNRVESMREIPALFTREFLWLYGGANVAGSAGVRPVVSAIFAMEWAAWGTNALGYHLTDLVVHVVNSILVLVVALRVLDRHAFSIGMVAALFFALHPLQGAAVPLIPGRFDLLLCTFSLLSFLALGRFLKSTGHAPLATLLVCVSLAVLTKETGVILWPIVIVTAAWSWLREPGRKGAPLLIMVGSVGGVVLAYVAYRALVVGGLGGYPVQLQSPMASIPLMVLRFFGPLVYPGAVLGIGPDAALSHLVVGGAALAAVLFALAGVLRTRGVAFPGFTALWRRLASDADALSLLTIWILGFFVMYLGAHAVTGVFKPLYLYTALSLVSIVLCTLGYHLIAAIKQVAADRRGGWPALARLAPLGAIALVGLGSWLSASPARVGLEPWGRGATLAREYLQAVETASATIAQPATVALVNLPQEVICADRPCIGRAYLLEDYTVDSWVRLRRPDAQLTFVSLSALQLSDGDPLPASHVGYDPAERTMSVSVTHGTIRRPFRSRRDEYVVTEGGGPESPQHVRFHLVNRSGVGAPLYLYDFFNADRLLLLRDGTLEVARDPARPRQ